MYIIKTAVSEPACVPVACSSSGQDHTWKSQQVGGEKKAGKIAARREIDQKYIFFFAMEILRAFQQQCRVLKGQ